MFVRHEFQRSKVHIVNPARLVMDGSVVEDKLPEWNQFVGAIRLATINDIAQIKANFIAKRHQKDRGPLVSIQRQRQLCIRG